LDLNFHVTSRNDIKSSAVIGNSVLKLVDLIFSENSVTFQQKGNHDIPESFAGEESVRSELHIFQEYPQMCLFAEGEDPEIDVVHLERPIAKTVKDLINSYKQMKILLNDEYPVYERPRRISPAEKTIIDNQVEKWLEEKIVQPRMAASAFDATIDD